MSTITFTIFSKALSTQSVITICLLSTEQAGGKAEVRIRPTVVSGVMEIYNAEGKGLVSIGTLSEGKSGYIGIYNAEGKGLFSKALVDIGSVEGHPNDGLINIYNHKGEMRSYIGD